MLCTHLSRVPLRKIKTNQNTWSIKPSRAEIYQNFLVVFWKIDDFINTFRHYLTFTHLSTKVQHCSRDFRAVMWLVKMCLSFVRTTVQHRENKRLGLKRRAVPSCSVKGPLIIRLVLLFWYQKMKWDYYNTG
mgnify:CR=1 FL=1